jgi:hypothetical protein
MARSFCVARLINVKALRILPLKFRLISSLTLLVKYLVLYVRSRQTFRHAGHVWLRLTGRGPDNSNIEILCIYTND